MGQNMKELSENIQNKTACIGIIGLGYVGLPLAIAFSTKFKTVGFDVNESYVNEIQKGKSNIIDVPDETLQKYLDKSFYPTSDSQKLSECEFLIICVPTPLTEQKEPNLKYVKSATQIAADVLDKDKFVILESTTYPGTTEEIVRSILEDSGLKAGEDFGLAYSPERIDPGNTKYNVQNTPKVVGGINPECTEIATTLYSCVIDNVVSVRDAKTAEAVKIVENIFRNVNIALVNELALIFERMNIDAWEVIDAAATKPYGFMPFYPGPGIGGHCIPLDPYYMSYKAKKHGFIPRFIETSGEINEYMKIHAVNLVEKGLAKVGRKLYGSNVAVMGLAYKKNVGDTRESPSIKIIEELVGNGANIRVYDPYAESIDTRKGTYYSEDCIEDTLKKADAAIFVVDHDEFGSLDIDLGVMNNPVVIDCKNIVKNCDDAVYYGIGRTIQ
jgi:UDP-N-acetyl-D-glucosamine dehydrogenase